MLLSRDTPNIRDVVFSGILFRCGLLFQSEAVIVETLHQLDMAGFFDLEGSAEIVGFFAEPDENELPVTDAQDD